MGITYYLGLCDKPFKQISDGSKTIEMRLNNEKRKCINVGDFFFFTNETTNETLKCKIINIFHYNNFEELYAHHDKSLLGYKENEQANPDDMLIYYTKEKINKYGVIGFQIEKCK